MPSSVDLDAGVDEALAHVGAQLRVEHALGRQHLVERTCRHRFADRELHEPVEPSVDVRDRGDRELRIERSGAAPSA